MMAKKENGDDQSKSESAKRPPAARVRETGARLEDSLWRELRAMAEERNVSLSELVNGIDIKRKRSSLTAAIRLFLSNYRRKRR